MREKAIQEELDSYKKKLQAMANSQLEREARKELGSFIAAQQPERANLIARLVLRREQNLRKPT